MTLFGQFNNFDKVKNEIYWFFQRGIKGYCDKDIWELNTWFAETFSRMLMELSDKTLSYPDGFGSIDNKIQKGLNPQSISKDESNEEYIAWKSAIKKAAEQFAATGGYSYRVPTEEQIKNRDEAFEFIRNNFYDLWW
ncbi:hypothetical protein SAMN05216349_1066 [Oribacterium sp. KHPX15]|uniref:hypothetical protein n=1 Tax=Oribacterium sp. KHPX15 TaxID=1855342 RepID=UPI0008988BE5|nr:hypothetical protein [Oribacterium sp. KHPX15]SEA17059.1 hypothetical protein SAMN05216349_1066 [Oribacterium sp. KHPX15]